jgi:ferredoxin-NADP reductase
MGVADAAINGLWTLTGLRRPADLSTCDRTQTLTVADRRIVARDQNVVALTLVAPDRRALPAWHPGAHLDLRLPSGRVRQYSLCGEPGQRSSYRIAVRRIPDGGGGSVEVHDTLTVGSTVTTSGPRNAFPMTVPGHGSPARRVRFIAGGIGITPILPMLGLAEQLGVPWSMVYAGRSVGSIPFLDEVRAFGPRIEIRTDDVRGVPSADDLLGDCPAGTTVYACGPPPMLTLIRERLRHRTDVELHFERFGPPPVIGGQKFTVVVDSTGQRITVGAEESLLGALRRSGVNPPYSCQQGFCGTCRTRVLDGAVLRGDNVLTSDEHDQGLMLTCVSRADAGSELRLDL